MRAPPLHLAEVIMCAHVGYLLLVEVMREDHQLLLLSFDVTNRSYLAAGRVPALNGRTEMQVLSFSVLARTPVETGGGSSWRNCLFTSPGESGYASHT